MTSPDDLASRLADEAERGAPRSAIDVAVVLRRSRARRRPALIGTGVLAIVAVVGIGGLGIAALGTLTPADLTAADSAPSSDGTEETEALADEGTALAPDWLQNRCGAPIVTPADVPNLGLELDVEFPDRASVGTESVPGMVRLTNTSAEVVTGTASAAPAVTLSEGGLTVWHTSGVGDGEVVDIALGPGESLDFPAVIRPLLCTPQDEARALEGFDEGLDAVSPGEYAVSAILDVTLDTGTAGRTPVVSEPQPVRLDGGEN